MIEIEKRVDNPPIEIIQVQPGTYYFKYVNAVDEKIYREIIVTEDSASWIAVKNEESTKSIGTDISYYELPWWIEQCFKGGKDVSVITKEVFQKEFNEVLQYLNALPVQ
jgi:hypothetical protein